MLASIMAALASLGEMASLIKELIQTVNKLSADYVAQQKQIWRNELHVEIAELEKASTPEEKLNAAKNLQDKIHSL